MPSQTIEERLSDLEAKVDGLIKEKCQPVDERWWRHHFGVFKDDPTFGEAVRLGAEYRKAQPNAADSPDAFDP